VVREALTNVAQHASASRVRVVLEATDGHLSITIIDYGNGPWPFRSMTVPPYRANAVRR
jgi:signal transduction histidine kinase